MTNELQSIFLTPPENQGQIVNVAYCCCGEYLMCWIHDNSDSSDSYAVMGIDGNDWDWYESYEPFNGAPPICRNDERWMGIDAKKVQQIYKRNNP